MLTQLGAEYASALEEITVVIDEAQSNAWQGDSADDFAAAHVPYQAWLDQASTNSLEAANQHLGAAVAYSSAVAVMPTPVQLLANRVKQAVLMATNFFGVNLIPIAANEAEYTEMWIRAAATMETYQTVSSAIVAAILPMLPAPPIVLPNVSEASAVTAVAAEEGAPVVGAIWELFTAALTFVWDTIWLLLSDLYEDWGGFEILMFLEELIDFLDTPEALLAVIIADLTAGVGTVGGGAPTSAVSLPLSLGLGIPAGAGFVSQVAGEASTPNEGVVVMLSKVDTAPGGVVSEVTVSDQGAGTVGFAGTAPSPTAASPSGLATLDGGFRGSPRMPLLPATWEASLVGAVS